MRLVECVPNFSEGRRSSVVAAIRAAAESVPGAALLDVHQDAVHNRSVLTLAGRAEAVLEAAFRCVREASKQIDMRMQRGEHPRIGAADVVPFVPLGSTTMADCVALAQRLGRRIGEELGIPVYLYAEAASRPERRLLANIRRPQYEGLASLIGADPSFAPDFGPATLGSAGATAVGARPFLIAFNVNLATSDLKVAKSIAGAIRASSGGLPAVQALGLRTSDPQIVQVSTNLLDSSRTPLHVLFEAIRNEASRRGVAILESELVGLLPAEALAATGRQALSARELTAEQVMEARLLDAWLREPLRDST